MLNAGCGCASLPCGCCEGTTALTPASRHNRPGLPALRYRVGTHGQFLQTMKARLSTIEVDATGPDGQPLVPPRRLRPLATLTARDTGDFAIALLDGWATLGDVLSFYQERIANEGYLRTAVERRSVLELARLVGYTLRPGVAASVHLAFKIDPNQADPVVIPAGARSQSLPGPGEAPQSFEISEDLPARREWNDLQVRRERPQRITLETALTLDRVHVQGAANLKAGDPLLFVFADEEQSAAMRTVAATESPFGAERTTIHLVPAPPLLARTVPRFARFVSFLGPFRDSENGATRRAVASADEQLRAALMDQVGEPAEWAPNMISAADGVIDPLLMQRITTLQADIEELLEDAGSAAPPPRTDPSRFAQALLKEHRVQARSSARLTRNLVEAFREGADTSPQLLVSFAPALKDGFYAAWANAEVNAAPTTLAGVYALRVSAALFGANAPLQPTYNEDGVLNPPSTWTEWPLEGEAKNRAWLDQPYPAVVAPSFAVVQRLDQDPGQRRLVAVTRAETAQRSAYGLSGKSTRLTFDIDWWDATPQFDMRVLRSTLIHAASEELPLAHESITDDVGGQEIELDGLYKELKSGRFVILSGERSDIEGVSGVHASELMMLAGVIHDYDSTLPGDRTHTTLRLATPTAYRYKRDTLVIHGNVVRATHGETRKELLGSGDGGQALQSFTLKQPPLTFTSAPTAAGAESTLAVYVDDVRWHETPSLAWLGPDDRGFATETDDEDKATVIFGDGEHGARPPTGVQNVRAVYRSGIGRGGNVQTGQINLLQTRPLGVAAVVNPLPASGGADRESRDLARENAPLSVMPLDRLVSVQDYADFTRRFAGIAKAVAVATTDGRREVVQLTVAGVDDAPIERTSDLYRNLLAALRELGDPALPVQLDARELKLLALSARIRLQPDRLWEPVVADVRATLLAGFGFAARGLGQPARLAEVIATIQGVSGVAYVDLDAFGGIPEKVEDEDGTRRLITLPEIARLARQAAGYDPDSVGLTAFRRHVPPDVAAWRGGFDRGVLRPAELAIFTPAVPDTLILNEVA